MTDRARNLVKMVLSESLAHNERLNSVDQLHLADLKRMIKNLQMHHLLDVVEEVVEVVVGEVVEVVAEVEPPLLEVADPVLPSRRGLASPSVKALSMLCVLFEIAYAIQ
jgi:hypothetical protein